MLRLLDLLGLSRLRGLCGRSETGLSFPVPTALPTRTFRDHVMSGGPLVITPGDGAAPVAIRGANGLASRSRAQEARRLRAVDRAIADITVSRRRK